MSPPDAERPPLVWRLPSWQPAVLFLVTAALAAWAIYGAPAVFVRTVVSLLAAAFLIAAVAAARMYLVADDEGVGVRRYAGEQSFTWDQVSGVAVTKVRGGAMTIEVQSENEAPIVVPPSLVLPLRPTSIARTSALLQRRAGELRDRRPASPRR